MRPSITLASIAITGSFVAAGCGGGSKPAAATTRERKDVGLLFVRAARGLRVGQRRHGAAAVRRCLAVHRRHELLRPDNRLLPVQRQRLVNVTVRAALPVVLVGLAGLLSGCGGASKTATQPDSAKG